MTDTNQTIDEQFRREHAVMRAALEWIANWDAPALAVARTLHYDMNGKAKDALRAVGVVVDLLPPLLCTCGKPAIMHGPYVMPCSHKAP